MDEQRRCNQCWKVKPWPEAFINPKTGKVRAANCADCITPSVEPRRGLDPHAPLRVRVVEHSQNRKHRGIPTTISSASTCPPRSCSFHGSGCFAEYHLLRVHWAGTPETGLEWGEFCAWVSKLPRGQIWRHNDAGDLPGKGERLNRSKLAQLVMANRVAGARGFTFTHKHEALKSKEARRAIKLANRSGFTINLSADSLAQADMLASLKIAPVAVVLPEHTTGPVRTPRGLPVAICPAQTHGMGCKECQLCARPNRAGIVGFLAHGQSKRRVSQIVQLRKKEFRVG